MSAGKKDSRARRHGWGFLALMRYLERRAGTKPKAGKSLTLGDEIAQLGQDPFMHFPDSDLSDVNLNTNPPVVRPRVVGFFGPFGPLPNTITREAAHWQSNGDSSFVRFTDMLTARFQQLFFRSWSDARPITQFDHPSGGAFPDYLRAFTGDAAQSYRARDCVDDTVRLRYTPLALGRVKSPVKLKELIRAHFQLPVRVEEFVTDWLDFPPEDYSLIGRQGVLLGQNMRIGARARSVGETITLHLDCPTREQMMQFLPGREQARELRDLILGYVGPFLDVNIALWLPPAAVPPMQLGQNAELGWMSALPRNTASARVEGRLVQVCRFRISQYE